MHKVHTVIPKSPPERQKGKSMNLKKSKLIIPLLIICIALAGLIGGASMLLAPQVEKSAQAATVNIVEDRIGGSTSRFTTSMTFDIPNFYKDFPIELRLHVFEYRMVMINLKPVHVIDGSVTVNANFEMGTANVILYNGFPPLGGTVTASRNSSNQLLISYVRNDSAYSVQVSDIWVVSYTTPDLAENQVAVRFVSPSENNLSFVVLNKNDKLTAAQIPAYTDFIPSLYRHSEWRTKGGLWAHETPITTDMDFYPVMVKNFEYGDRLNNDQIVTAYDEGKYDNATLASGFSNGAYKLPADSSIQATKDPILLTEFSINSMQIPWGKNETYFTFTLDVPRSNDFIPQSVIRKNLVLKSDNNYVRLMYGSQELKSWIFDDFIKQPKNDKKWLQNQVTFQLAVIGNGTTEPFNIRWQLQYGQAITDNTTTHSGYLPDGVYRYGLNDNIGFLGLVGVNINRNADYSHTWKTGGFLGIGQKTHKHDAPTIYPTISIKGCEAQIKKAVKCYIEGEHSFTANLPVNHFEKPILPTEVEKADSTIRWYLDAAYTQALLSNFHTAQNYNELYGKWVPAEYDVTLVYYTVDRFRADLNGGKYYDALVKKTFTKTYVKGSNVNLYDYGADIYGVNFYDNIQQIKFLGWDSSITAPVTGNTTITAQYKFPTATLRYYDVDDKLYGTVTQQMLMFPVDILLEEVKQADASHKEWWLHERPEDKGLLGRVYGFLESIARTVFGGDNIGNGANAAMREDQKKDARYIIEQLEREHNTRNAYGEHRLYFLPVVYLDINLEQLNKGAYGNEAFNVREEDNPQWHLISGTPKLNNLVYYADVHNVYSLGNSNFTMAINFEKKMDGFDAMAKTAANIAGYVGKFFGDIFGSLFRGLSLGFDGVTGILVAIALTLLAIIFFFAIAEVLKSVFKIGTYPINKTANKLDARLRAQKRYNKKQRSNRK